MKRTVLFILLCACCSYSFSQEVENTLITKLRSIRLQQGDSIARCYLDSQKDSLEQNGENASYILLWGVLTSNMWHANPTESITQEYEEYLNHYIYEFVEKSDIIPNHESLEAFWQLSYDYSIILYRYGNIEEALALLTRIHNWFEPYPEMRNTTGYCETLLDLCTILAYKMHKHKEAEPYLREYANVAKAVYGESSAEYALALYLITGLHHIPLEETISLLENAISLYESAGIPDIDIFNKMKRDCDVLKNIISETPQTVDLIDGQDLTLVDCLSLVKQGKGEKALTSILRYRDNIRNEEYLDTLGYTSATSVLIRVYLEMGDLSSAQKEFDNLDKLVGISTDYLPDNYVQVLLSLAGQISFGLKDYHKALQYSQASCDILEASGNYGLEYAKILASMAMIYAEAGQVLDEKYYLDAKWYIDEAVSAFEEHIGPLEEHGDYGITLLSNKALVLDKIGDRKDAISTFEYIVKNFSNDKDISEPCILAINNLAALYFEEGRYNECVKILRGVKSKHAQVNYMLAMHSALGNMFLKDYSEVSSALAEMNRYFVSNINNVFSYFSVIEREDYWDLYSHENNIINNAAAYHTDDGQVTSIAYNNMLFTKTLLLNFTQIFNHVFSQSAEEELKNDYITYTELKEKLSYKSTSQTEKSSISAGISKFEKSLLNNTNIGQLLTNNAKTWEDVQQSLGDNEIAVEFCYAPHWAKYPEIQRYYGAFVLRKDFDYPKLISLEKVSSVDEVVESISSDELFINELYSSDQATFMYNMLWKKISPYLSGIKTIYYSPTGSLYNINFDVLRGEDGQMLHDKYNMIRVSSTGNIGEIKSLANERFNSCVLYGNITYEETTAEMADASSAYNTFTGTNIQAELSFRSEDERGKWGPIPSTKKEIDNISTSMSVNGVEVSVFEGAAANEESFKALSEHSPDIIHLATHGFVIDTPQKAEGNKFVASTSIYSQKDSYLMWSGLMLAGGNNIWQGKFDLNNVEDGILTADEISRLDLSNTKLVVLSACETARGKVDAIDGVYGLQRAFKIAGAQTIVMSLWKVQDDATSILMTQFYTYLMSGKERHQALWMAMMDVKEKYKDPYYWAGFVMLD